MAAFFALPGLFILFAGMFAKSDGLVLTGFLLGFVTPMILFWISGQKEGVFFMFAFAAGAVLLMSFAPSLYLLIMYALCVYGICKFIFNFPRCGR